MSDLFTHGDEAGCTADVEGNRYALLNESADTEFTIDGLTFDNQDGSLADAKVSFPLTTESVVFRVRYLDLKEITITVNNSCVEQTVTVADGASFEFEAVPGDAKEQGNL